MLKRELEKKVQEQEEQIQKLSEIIYDFEHTEFEIDVARYSTMAFSGSSSRVNSPAIQAIIMDSVTELNGEEFIGKRLKVRLVHPQVEYPWKEKDIEAISFEDI